MSKKEWKNGPIFVAFSEYLNFNFTIDKKIHNLFLSVVK